jgi:hypothetical protein
LDRKDRSNHGHEQFHNLLWIGNILLCYQSQSIDTNSSSCLLPNQENKNNQTKTNQPINKQNQSPVGENLHKEVALNSFWILKSLWIQTFLAVLLQVIPLALVLCLVLPVSIHHFCMDIINICTHMDYMYTGMVTSLLYTTKYFFLEEILETLFVLMVFKLFVTKELFL